MDIINPLQIRASPTTDTALMKSTELLEFDIPLIVAATSFLAASLWLLIPGLTDIELGVFELDESVIKSLDPQLMQYVAPGIDCVPH